MGFEVFAEQELPVHACFRGCPTTHRMPTTVILSKAKNLIDSATYTFEIFRLTVQNDFVEQPFQGVLDH